jgi:HK97 family phage prohead protease
MPYTVRKTSKCKASKPWGVFKKDGGALVSCHTSKAKAQSAIAAIYANTGGKSTNHNSLEGRMAKTAVKQVLRRMVVPFSIKAAADSASHTFEGLAAVIGVKDLGNDIIEPGAFKNTLLKWKASGDALPLLNSHNQYDIMCALGQLISAKETPDGLQTKWEVIPGPEGDCVMTRLMPSEVTGRPIVGKMSIGYIPIKWDIEQPEGTTSYFDQIRHLTEVDLKECSLVLFPMAPGAAIDASSVKSFNLSAQATDPTVLDLATKAELRKLATRIGNLLSSKTTSIPVIDPLLDEKRKGKKKPIPESSADDEETPAGKDDPEHPSNDDIDGTDESEDEDLDVVADLVKDAELTDEEPDDYENPLDPDDAETPPKGKKKKPKKPMMDDPMSDVAKAAPYEMQEALQHRLKMVMFKNRVTAINQKTP